MAHPPHDDTTLIRLARSGDSASFRGLMLRYQGRMWRIAFRAAGDTASAEDLLQDIWVKVHRALPVFRDGEPFGPWISRIGTNAACDFLRRRAARPRGDVIPWELAARGPDPEAVLLHLQRARRVKAALLEIPAEQREALLLRHYADLSYEEIAVSLERPVGTVKTLIHRGRERLRTLLDPSLEMDDIPWTADGLEN